MTLRARLALLTTALLGVVLAVSGVVLERATERDAERALEDRVRDRLRTPLPPREPERARSGRIEREPDAHALPPEVDGASVEVFHFEITAPAPGASGGPPVLRVHSFGGPARVPEADARRRAEVPPRGDVSRVALAGTTWLVVAQPTALEPVERRGAGRAPRPPPPPPDDRGGREPPPPPDEGRPAPPPRPYVTIAYLDTAPAMALHRAFVVRLAGIGVGALLLGGLLAYALAGRMLRPVAAAARAAEAIADPAQRLPDPTSPDELGRLVNVLNGMLARLQAASDRERLFLATASHELRRPLTALSGELELASAAGRTPEELRSAVRLALEDARSMARLVDDVLHHARAQAGALRVIESESGLDAVVLSAIARSRRALERPVEIDARGVGHVVVRADADLLRRAIENLVVNAAVHGGEGVRVVVSAEVGEREVSVHVDDDGPGVPEAERRAIFDPFGRGDRARSVPGFGLGLAIAHDVARAHGGTLALVSPRPGADVARPGSRFTLALPRSRVVGEGEGARTT